MTRVREIAATARGSAREELRFVCSLSLREALGATLGTLRECLRKRTHPLALTLPIRKTPRAKKFDRT